MGAVSIVLTSEQKQKGHFLKNRELVLFINGQIHDEFLSHKERVYCLKSAIIVFDNQLQTVANEFKNNPFGAYLWLYTPDFIRGEEISGLFRLLYLKEIIKYLKGKVNIEKLKVDVPISTNDKLYFQEIGLKPVYCRKPILINHSHNIIQKTKVIYTLFKFNFAQLLRKSNIAFDGVLIDTSTNFHKSRYDKLENVTEIFNQNVKYFSGDQLDVRGCDKNDVVVFKRELNLKMLATSLIKSFHLNRFIVKNKDKIPLSLYDNHKGFYKMLLYWDLILAQKSIDKYLVKSNIQTIVQVSTLTKPLYRSLIASAKENSTKFIQVASRSLTRLRCSERLLEADVNGYNETALPDGYIFKDKYSTKIFDDFPELKKKALLGSRYLMNDFKINPTEDKPLSLFVLFNHRKDISFKLLQTVSKLNSIHLFKTIIYRCHPSFIFENKDINAAFHGKEIIDITGKDYNILLNYKVMAISGPTTAALEALSFGSLIYWAPFVYDDAILMDDVMNHIGINCPTDQILDSQIKNCTLEPNRYSNLFQKDYRTLHEDFTSNNLITESLKKIVSNEQ